MSEYISIVYWEWQDLNITMDCLSIYLLFTESDMTWALRWIVWAYLLFTESDMIWALWWIVWVYLLFTESDRTWALRWIVWEYLYYLLRVTWPEHYVGLSENIYIIYWEWLDLSITMDCLNISLLFTESDLSIRMGCLSIPLLRTVNDHREVCW